MPYIINYMKQVFVFNECIKKWAQFGWMQTNYVSPISLHATDILLSSVAMQNQFDILLHTHICWRYPYLRYSVSKPLLSISFSYEKVVSGHILFESVLYFTDYFMFGHRCVSFYICWVQALITILYTPYGGKGKSILRVDF